MKHFLRFYFHAVVFVVLANLLLIPPRTGFAMSEALAAASTPPPVEKPLPPGFLPLKESSAFRQYQLRPKNDLSKLIFLIDRFTQTDIEIIYEGFHLPAVKAAGIARWFLGRNYRHETPSEWIYLWCNKTVPNGKLIMVKFSDGTVRLGREILFDELAELEKASA